VAPVVTIPPAGATHQPEQSRPIDAWPIGTCLAAFVRHDMWRKVSLVAVLVIVSATASFAQAVEPQSIDSLRLAGEPKPEARRAADKTFWLVAAGLNTTMLLDTKSTFDVMRRCASCEEANPFVRPFVQRGPTLTVAAGVAFDAEVMAIAAKMKRSERPWLRHTWWVVPVALMTGHTIAWRHNTNLR
jgi:hypothetical protein